MALRAAIAAKGGSYRLEPIGGPRYNAAMGIASVRRQLVPRCSGSLSRSHLKLYLVLALSLATGGLLSAGCGLPEGDYFGRMDPEPGHLRFCNSNEPEWIDPGLVTSTTGIPLALSLFDGLTEFDMKGLPEPSLATHWDISPDQRRFTFYLRRDGKWSDGSQITASDFVFSMMRILHPLTFSRNADLLWSIKAGKTYTEGRAKMVTRDTAGFTAGDTVEVLGVAGVLDDAGNTVTLPGTGLRDIVDPNQILIPDSNLRTAEVPLPLRDRGAPVADAYATVPVGEEVTIVEMDPSRTWAYVHWSSNDGVYGWTPAKLLTGQPNGEVVYWVRQFSKPHRVGVELDPDDILRELDIEQRVAQVRGSDLLMLPEILGIRTPDDYTLVLETWGPVPFLISMSSQRSFRVVPRKAVSRYPLRWTRSPETIITSGAFHLVGWYERDRIDMVKSKTYWRRDQVPLERFTAYAIGEQSSASNYYLQGGCDATAGNHIPSSYMPFLSGEKRDGRAYKDYHTAPYLGAYFYIINTEKMTNRHLRRALNFSVDRRPLPEILHGGQIPSAQFTPGERISDLSDEELKLCGVTRETPGVAMIVKTGELCYVPPPGLDFNLEKAKEELALAKEQMGADFPSKLSVKFNSGSEGHKLIAEYLQHEWKEKLGLDVELTSQEWKTYLKATTAGEFEIGRMGWIGNFPDPESEFVNIFQCGSPYNRPRWCNDRFDRLFRELKATSDRKRRLALLQQAEAVLIEEAAIIPLYVYAQSHLQKPYLTDLAINLSDKRPFFRSWIDPNWRMAATRGGDAP